MTVCANKYNLNVEIIIGSTVCANKYNINVEIIIGSATTQNDLVYRYRFLFVCLIISDISLHDAKESDRIYSWHVKNFDIINF